MALLGAVGAPSCAGSAADEDVAANVEQASEDPEKAPTAEAAMTDRAKSQPAESAADQGVGKESGAIAAVVAGEFAPVDAIHIADLFSTSGRLHLEWARSAELPTELEHNGSYGDRATQCSSEGAMMGACPDASRGGPGYVSCTTSGWGHSEVRTLADITALVDHPNIFPGAVIQGRYLSDTGDFALVDVPRAGGRIVLSGPTLTAGAASFRDVGEIRGSTVQDAISDVLGSVRTTRAELSLTEQDMYSREQLMFEFGADARIGAARFGATIGVDGATTRNVHVLKFTQVFYHVSFEPPLGSPSLVFRDGEDFQDPSFSIGAGNPPLYVSDVAYGRQIFVSLVSSESSNQLRLAFNAAYDAGSAAASAMTRVQAESILRDAEVIVAVRGGNASRAATTLAGSGAQKVEQIRALIADPVAAAYSPKNPGAPIAYSVNYLLTGARAEMAYHVARYNRSECERIPARPFRLSLQGTNIDDDMWVYLARPENRDNPDAWQRIFVTNTRVASGASPWHSVDLTAEIARFNAGSGALTPFTDTAVIVKLGNGGGFGSSGDFRVCGERPCDSEPLWSFGFHPVGWRTLGWQVEAKLNVNPATGEVRPVGLWTGI
jgi:hypothetical protein